MVDIARKIRFGREVIVTYHKNRTPFLRKERGK